MEKSLNKCLEDISQVAGVKSCLLTDEQGLSLGSKGRIAAQSSGIVTALAQQAAHLEPDNPKRPVIILENDNRQCYIHGSGKIIAAVQKIVSS
ncbi:ragulator complex protein LAMTOR5 [Periplaneta americana]|uniref:ragulator complex protein LAMTOR5 n=1 Tax=Periplaneta americana TaxID=6978 RepID=UPI0037E8BBA2